MSDTNIDQEVDFLKNGPWEKLYVITEHWQSDLEFYKDDLRFLHHLIEKYFMWITMPENLEMVKEIKKDLFELNTKVKDLLGKMGKHRIQLGYLVENYNQDTAGLVSTEHQHLEEEMAQFVKTFRSNRKEVFKITEYIIDSEKLGQIMHS